MDTSNLIKYFTLFGIPCILVLVSTPLLVRLAPRFGLMDFPNERRIHKVATPLGGGIVIFVAFHLCAYFLYNFIWPDYQGLLNQSWWHAFLFSSSLILAVGIIDDIRGMSALFKLAGQTIACLSMYFLYGKTFAFFGTNTPEYLNLIFILSWYLIIINAFNLIDGLDGLCTGLAMISSLGLAAVYILQTNPFNALICLALAGACIGFLRYNFHPASIFLGDSGSMFLGFTLASISLYAGGKSSFFVAIATPFFIAGVPIIDTLLAIWRRSIRKALADQNGTVNIMQADKEHLHHRLLAMGLNQHRVALILYGINSIIVICGLIYILAGNHAIGFFLIIFIAATYILVKHVLQIERWETNRAFANLDKNTLLTRLSFIYRPVFDLIWMALSFSIASYIIHQGNLPFISLGIWASHLPAWLMPTFILLIFSHSYNKVWRNAFFKDYLFLTLSVFTGCLLSMAIISLLDSGFSFVLINQSLLFCLFSFIGVTGSRVIFNFIKEWGMNSEPPPGMSYKRNILLYGAGLRGGLYIRERYLQHSTELGMNNIVGFIDDDPALRKRYLFGMEVFGGLDELPTIVKDNKVDQIVITTPLSKESYQSLITSAQTLGLTVFDWKTHSTQINLADKTR